MISHAHIYRARRVVHIFALARALAFKFYGYAHSLDWVRIPTQAHTENMTGHIPIPTKISRDADGSGMFCTIEFAHK